MIYRLIMFYFGFNRDGLTLQDIQTSNKPLNLEFIYYFVRLHKF